MWDSDGRTIRGFFSLASAKICSVPGFNLKLDESTLWNSPGQVAWRSFEFRRTWREEAAGGGYAIDVDWGRSCSLWHLTIGIRPH